MIRLLIVCRGGRRRSRTEGGKTWVTERRAQTRRKRARGGGGRRRLIDDGRVEHASTRTSRARRTGADVCPSSRWWSSLVRESMRRARGTESASSRHRVGEFGLLPVRGENEYGEIAIITAAHSRVKRSVGRRREYHDLRSTVGVYVEPGTSANTCARGCHVSRVYVKRRAYGVHVVNARVAGGDEAHVRDKFCDYRMLRRDVRAGQRWPRPTGMTRIRVRAGPRPLPRNFPKRLFPHDPRRSAPPWHADVFPILLPIYM